jgi:ABC-type uncharacterized transport system auxiliary subunit
MSTDRIAGTRCAGRGLRLGLLIGALAGAGGCTGSLFQSKTPALATYLLSADLSPGSPGAAGAATPLAGPLKSVAADLAVQRPRVRAGLETDRIAVLYPDRRLDYFADARWSGPLDQVVQDLTVQAFETGAHLRTVAAESSEFPSGYWLEMQVAEFQAEYAAAGAAPTVNVHLLARLGAAGDRRVMATFDALARRSAADNRLSDIVDAYERAADSALGQIVAEATRALTAAPGASSE